MHVAAILKRKGNAVITASAEDTVRSVVELLTRHGIGAVVVVGPAKSIEGILSERDVVRCLGEGGPGVLDERVSRLMTSEVVTCAPGDSVADIMRLMTERRIRHVPVLDGGEMAGLVSIGDVVKERLEETEHEVEALRSYVAGT